jgi:hypothetical protein
MGKVYPDGTKPVRGKGQTDEYVGEMSFVVLMFSIQYLTEVIEFIGENSVFKTPCKGNS